MKNMRLPLGVDSKSLRELLPELERKHSWFSHLLNAYIFLDASLKRELAVLGRQPACVAGCAACCCQPIPLSLAESMGIQVFLKEVTPVYPATASEKPEEPLPWQCPFLVSGNCAIYPVRPFACRRFLVFSHPCASGEDPVITRPGDVHTPSAATLLRAQRFTLPAYPSLGYNVEEDAGAEFFTRHSTLIQNIPWKK